ncbi:MAG: type II toxin-antitoxin system MqsR family toxin [Firmicutes bacterium]|nr:type II toxin-antitoxin system MqsR family toxin [Bacillota bacterium]
MTNEQIKLLSKMKELIIIGKRRFQIRPDRDYIADLLEIGITQSEAWNQILFLNKNFFYIDPKPTYRKNNDTLIFLKVINGIDVYIKLRIEEDEVVCISFHKSNVRR